MYSIFTDGGARGNPGPAATGIVVYQHTNHLGEFPHIEEAATVIELSSYIGETTNNVAEWKAVIQSVEWLKNNHINQATCYLDSQLVQRQILGRYKVKDVFLKQLKNQFDVITQGMQLQYIHIERAYNKRADFLVNRTLDAQ